MACVLSLDVSRSSRAILLYVTVTQMQQGRMKTLFLASKSVAVVLVILVGAVSLA
jgi:hypothetical protein